MFNQKHLEMAENLIFSDSLKIITLSPLQFKKCCAIVDYYMSEKYLFLSNCKYIDAEKQLEEIK
mgnify:CR=1 FL=1